MGRKWLSIAGRLSVMMLSHSDPTATWQLTVLIHTLIHLCRYVFSALGPVALFLMCYLQLCLYFAWTSSSDDAFWYDAMQASVNTLKNVAIQEGIYNPNSTAYPNYAITGTTAQELYGSQNTARLSAIRGSVDPDSIMELAGGFSI